MKLTPAFVFFLLTTQIASANWTFSEKPYEMDKTKVGCTASINTDHNDLEINFPKDGKGFPIVKMTNKFDRDYFGARLFLSRDRIRFIGKDDSGKTEFYMIPRTAEQLETVINIIKRDRKLTIEKVYNRSGRFATGSGEFSLRGSSAALNKVQECLGGGELLSSAQEQLILDLNKRSFVSLPDDLGINYSSYMDLGKKVFEGIQNWDKRSADSEQAQQLVEEKKQGEEYKSLKAEKRNQDSIISKSQDRQKVIASNESFFQNADGIISNLESDLQEKEAEETALNVSVNSQESVLSGLLINLEQLENTLASAQGQVDLSQGSVSTAESNISLKEGEISDIEDVIRGSIQRESGLVAQTRRLRDIRDDAKWKNDNSRRVKRELEESLYNQFGGRPTDLEGRRDSLSREIKQLTGRSERLNDYKEDMDDVEELAQRITAITPDVQRVREELRCFKTSQGAESAKCLESSKKAIEASIAALTAARTGHQRNKCKRLFGIGSKKCKKRRDAAIRRLTGEINVATGERDALLERIRIIRTTGDDPQRAQSIANLERKLKEKVALRDRAIKATQDKISSIRAPRGNRIPALNNVLSCQPTARKTCERLASQASRRLEAMATEANRAADTLVAQKSVVEENLRDLNSALRNQVDGIETRLFNEWRTAEANYQANISSIGREDALQATKNSELATAQITLGGLRQELGRALDNLRVDQSTRDEASRNVSNYRINNEIDAKKARLDADLSKLAKVAKETIDLGKDISNAKSRKARIANEIDSYPTEKTEIEASIEEANLALEQILPRFSELQDEINQLQAEANRLNSENRAAQQTVKASIELIRTKY
ncbi:MAG: hypothetical protein NXH75_00775 [Halobacteriovoraceae bacterium]|nr:hypothetical protein [Halobacteriovoraceae bacterium]